MSLVPRLAPPAAIAALAAAALAVSAAPASAARNDPCQNARAAYQSHMTQARFWIGLADVLAAAGQESDAQLATDEANRVMDLANGDLSESESAC
jgi:hypothetical protein